LCPAWPSDALSANLPVMQVQTLVLQVWEDGEKLVVQASTLPVEEAPEFWNRPDAVEVAVLRSLPFASVSVAYCGNDAELAADGSVLWPDAPATDLIPRVLDVFFDVIVCVNDGRRFRFTSDTILGRAPEHRGFAHTAEGEWHLPRTERLACLLRLREHLESGWVLRGASSGPRPGRVLLAVDPVSLLILDAKLVRRLVGAA
jgi:hypothetical protein